MHLLDCATVISYHRHRVAEYGLGSTGALGWREPASQQCRFEVIASAADFSHSSVLDVGCGTGDLLPYLAERFAGLHYLGIDTVPEFIELARNSHAHQLATQFETGNALHLAQPLPRADHVVASGPLSYRSREPDFLHRAIAHLFAAARRTLIFNVLDAACFPPDHPLLVGHDLATVEAYCRSLTPHVRVIRGYASDDATFVLKPAPRLPGCPLGSSTHYPE